MKIESPLGGLFFVQAHSGLSDSTPQTAIQSPISMETKIAATKDTALIIIAVKLLIGFIAGIRLLLRYATFLIPR